MKVAVFLFVTAAAAVSVASALPAKNSRNVLDDYQDFISLMPMEELLLIFEDYFANDEQVRNMTFFENSNEYKKLILGFEAVPEYQQLLKFIQNEGFDIYSAMEFLHWAIELPPFNPPALKTSRRGTGLQGMFDDFNKLIPWNEVRSLSVQKYENSETYRALYNMLNSPRYKQLFCFCDASQDFQDVIAYGRQHGSDPYLSLEFNLRILNIEMVHC